MRQISKITRTARKQHCCDAWGYIKEGKLDGDTYLCKGISKGEAYEHQVNTDSSCIWSFKACLPCLKYAAEYDVDLTGE